MRMSRMFAMFALAFVVALGMSASLMAKPGDAGPAEKATGGIEVEESTDTASVEFNAHEAKGNRDAKGVFWWWLGGKDDPSRTIKVEVRFVKVDGDKAWFAGKAVMDTGGAKEDDWFFVQALDGGTPATDGDQIWWEWLGEDAESEAEEKVEDMEEPANEKTILAGNLVVHTEGGGRPGTRP